MHILVTNDDGIDSAGLWALAGALQQAGLGTVTIVAPEEEQSGMSMSLPPRAMQTVRGVSAPDPAHAGIAAYTYSGTPVGCVTAGMLAGLGPRPDVVVSGINRGLNAGSNVLLSGTVGAAMIAALWGLPAMAVSQQFIGDAPMPWATAAWAAAQLFPLLPLLRKHGPLVLNVNVPHIHRIEDLKGFRQTGLSTFFYGHYVDLETQPIAEAEDDRRRVRFHFRRERIPTFLPESDDGAVRDGYVAVTLLAPFSAVESVDLGESLGRLEPGKR